MACSSRAARRQPKLDLTAGFGFIWADPENRTFEDLLSELTYIDQPQKLCILANIMEICMKDGVLRTSEQNLIAQFATAMDLTDEVVQTIRDTLLIKNQTSVLV